MDYLCAARAIYLIEKLVCLSIALLPMARLSLLYLCMCMITDCKMPLAQDMDLHSILNGALKRKKNFLEVIQKYCQFMK